MKQIDSDLILSFINEKKEFTLNEVAGHYCHYRPTAPLGIPRMIKEHLQKLCQKGLLQKSWWSRTYRIG